MIPMRYNNQEDIPYGSIDICLHRSSNDRDEGYTISSALDNAPSNNSS
jgi:hypothetical protein